MDRKLGRIAAVIALASFPVAAPANWQYTHWGMKKADAMAASNGSMRETDNALPGIGLKGSYAIGERAFQAVMFFDAAGGLTMVMLSQGTAGDCRQTLEDLRDKYGAGYVDRAGKSSIEIAWRDDKSGNRVKYVDLSSLDALGGPPMACAISYEPIDRVEPGL